MEGWALATIGVTDATARDFDKLVADADLLPEKACICMCNICLNKFLLHWDFN